jgi:hypothetical protein
MILENPILVYMQHPCRITNERAECQYSRRLVERERGFAAAPSHEWYSQFLSPPPPMFVLHREYH